jgi:hypothetical protein
VAAYATGLALTVAVAVSALLAGCSPVARTPSPTPTSGVTVIPLNPTPWPSGTVGQYGLRIDPTLLTRLPATVGGLPLVESADLELSAMDNADLAANFDAFAGAGVGSVADSNWLSLVIGRLKAEAQTQDFYVSWVEQYGAGACLQADGVDTTEKETIDDWDVDVITCKGGVVVYVVLLDDGILLSIQDLGSRHLGRQLIEALP